MNSCFWSIFTRLSCPGASITSKKSLSQLSDDFNGGKIILQPDSAKHKSQITMNSCFWSIFTRLSCSGASITSEKSLSQLSDDCNGGKIILELDSAKHKAR